MGVGPTAEGGITRSIMRCSQRGPPLVSHPRFGSRVVGCGDVPVGCAFDGDSSEEGGAVAVHRWTVSLGVLELACITGKQGQGLAQRRALRDGESHDFSAVIGDQYNAH